MQFNKSLIAIAALAAGSAMAATPVARIGISSGASASKNNLKLALANRCSGQLAEFTDGTANVSTYVCAPAGSFANGNAPTVAEYNAAGAVNFTGTVFAELRLNVNGGSFTAVCLLAGWPAPTACPAADLYYDPAVGAMAAVPAGAAVLGGLMDAEPNAFLGSVRAGITLPAGTVTASASFGQTFGVAVSPALYNAMFADQQAAGLIPASPTCDVTLTNVPACVPSIGKAQMATVMAGNPSNAFYANGANFLAPGLAAGTPVTYARRVDTSGTQATAQQYFLGNVCNPSGSISVVGGGQTLGPVTVTNLATTGNVRAQLNSVSAYVIGVMSGENNQTAQNWRWLRVGGTQLAENAAPGTAGQTNAYTAVNGYYDYWYLSRVVRPNVTAVANFWNAVITGLGSVPAGNTAGLFRTSETNFSRGTLTSCQTVQSN
jgi:hypothetical protein